MKFSIFNFQFSMMVFLLRKTSRDIYIYCWRSQIHSLKFENSKLKINQSGFTMVVLMAAFLVLFVTVSLVKVGTLDKIIPDLRRIGINLSAEKDQNLAQNPASSIKPANTEKPQIVDTPKTEISVASLELEVEAENSADPEADNPKYIE